MTWLLSWDSAQRRSTKYSSQLSFVVITPGHCLLRLDSFFSTAAHSQLETPWPRDDDTWACVYIMTCHKVSRHEAPISPESCHIAHVSRRVTILRTDDDSKPKHDPVTETWAEEWTLWIQASFMRCKGSDRMSLETREGGNMRDNDRDYSNSRQDEWMEEERAGLGLAIAAWI